MGKRTNITATIIWFAIMTGVTAGLSYHKEKITPPEFWRVFKKQGRVKAKSYAMPSWTMQNQ